MAVCSRCKSENDDHRLRCGKCGNTLSKRGEFAEQQGPAVVVLGSVEDLRRARQLGELDESGDDPTALGWLESDELEEKRHKSAPQAEPATGTRRVSVREIDKISGLRDLRELQKALLKKESEPGTSAPALEPPTGTRRVSVRESDKISGVREQLRELQKALSKEESEPGKSAPALEPPPRTETRRYPQRPPASPPAAPAQEAQSAPRSESAVTTSRRVVRPQHAAPSPPPPMAPSLKESTTDDDLIERAPGPITAYLVNELFSEPVALTNGRRYLMGRDPRASIFLPSAHVSRRHAGIAADDKGDFWIEDLRSSNGTYVNGRAVIKRKLKNGDLLDVGVFTFRFVLREKPGDAPPRATSDPNEETRVIRAVPGALSGDIERNGVAPVVAILSSARRTGVLTLRAGKQVGRIFLIEGEIHHAQFGKAVGEAALAALLPAEAGFLHFTDEKIQVQRTITRPTAQILGA
jgi:pSer/pThr/pTyr-binding forkhead associated (FHA) protein